MEQKQSLLVRWAKGEKLSSLAKDLGVKTSMVRPALGIPPKGSEESYSFRLSLLAPHLKCLKVERKKSGTGTSYVYLTVEDTRDGASGDITSEELTSKLRADPEVFLFSRDKKSHSASLDSLLLDKSAEEKAAILRWAKGESMSKVAKDMGQSRSRLTLRLGLPAAYSEEYFRIRLQAVSDNFELVSLQDSQKSSDKVLRVKDKRTGKEIEHTSSWVFKCLKEDPEYTFFPSYEETMRRRDQRGTSTLIDGMTQRQYAEKIGSSYATVNVAVNKFGAEARTILDKFSKTESTLENIAASWFDVGEELIRNKKLDGTSYFPDLVLPRAKLIIECDGLFWHSEAQKSDKKYHKKKREAYIGKGFRPFFFREDEILTKPNICKSIVLNFLGGNKKVYARSTNVVPGSTSFFSDFHLMGKGSGTIYSLVDREGNTLAAMQVRFKSKKEGVLDVSRFCSRPGVTVVGGFSKLLSHAISALDPKSVQTFIDLRYGDGSYLKSLGWELTSQHVSFVWTDMKGNSYHRMKFPGSTGLQKGMVRVWDCGQAKWTLTLPRP